jgi:predicted nicotinamide N-methyase
LQLHAHRFSHGPVRLEVPAAPDLDALVTDETDPEHIPFWAVLWESAPVLARWLLDRQDWTSTPVLELGCGAGLTGLALAAAGARVTQTDLFPEAVSLARRNASRNGISGIRHLAADWCRWPLRGQWPVVVASDVLYERRAHAPLLEVLRLTLAPTGTAFLADPGRPMLAAFLARAAEHGWSIQQTRSGDVALLACRARLTSAALPASRPPVSPP